MSNQSNSNFDNEKVGSLWKRKSKKGTDYLTGEINGQRVMIFKAKNKRNESSPDYYVFDAPARDGGSNGNSQRASAPRRTSNNQQQQRRRPSQNEVEEDNTPEEELF